MLSLFNSFLSSLSALRSDKSGVTAIEYGLIAGLIAVAIIVIITTVGNDLVALFTTVSDGIAGASSESP